MIKIFNVKNLLLLLVIGPLMTLCCTSTAQNETPCRRVSVEQFAEKVRDGKLQVIDIRTPAETAQGMIEGAIELNFRDETFSEELGKLDRNKPYGIYCKGGTRSAKALKEMESLGFTDVIELEGGFDGYRKYTAN